MLGIIAGNTAKNRLVTVKMDRLYVNLAKMGDVVHVLPCLWLDHQEGHKPAMMVHPKYADVLDGVSYVEPVSWDGDEMDCGKAFEKAKTLCADVRCPQIGTAESNSNTRESFVRDAWRLAGRDDAWKDQPPLIFDRRNHEREAALVAKHIAPKKKTILIAANGTTSPIASESREFLFEMLKLKFSKFSLVDISAIKAHRFYDLLGLYEKAHCLISIDSAPLHLAPAVNTLPVIALVADKPAMWNGSPWRPNHICHIRYSDFPQRMVDVFRAIEGVGKPGCWFNVTPMVTRKIIHVWSQYELNPRNRENHHKAQTTWGDAYKSPGWISTRIDVGALGQDSAKAIVDGNRIEDNKRFPFLKEVLRLACMRAKDDDILCFTRADTCFEPGLTDKLLQAQGPVYAHRIVKFASHDSWHVAVDLFAFTKKWWNEHKSECPHFIVGTDAYWHRGFMEFVKLNGGTEIKDAIYRLPTTPVASQVIPKRELFNENATRKFMEAKHITHLVPKIEEQTKVMPVSRRALFPYGYNPSIVRHDKTILMAYRWHDKGTPATSLAMAELDANWNVLSNTRIEIAGQGNHSAEDARLFWFRDELYALYVLSTWPEMPPKAVMVLSNLSRDGKGVWQMDSENIPHVKGNMMANDWSCVQKNWCPFVYEDEVWAIFTSTPAQEIIRLRDGKTITTPALKWKYGEVRGGTTPILYQGKWLRFFHSAIDSEVRPYFRRYFVGAILMEPEPPFAPIAISKDYILAGSESDSMTDTERAACQHWKPKVVFPMGATECDGGFFLSVGENDSCSLITKITPEQLKL